MSFSTTAISIGDATKKADYDRLMANTVYNKSFREIETKSADYTITDTDTFNTVFVTTGAADKTITLPTVADNTGRIIKVVKIDSGVGYAIVDGEGAETINGTATWEITEQYGYIQVQSTGSEWIVIDKNVCTIYLATADTNGSSLAVDFGYTVTTLAVKAGIYNMSGKATIKLGSGSTYISLAISESASSADDITLCSMFYCGGISINRTDIQSLHINAKKILTSDTTMYLNASAGSIAYTDEITYAYSSGIATGVHFIRAERIA